MKTVIVTGGAGFIGSHTIECLIRTGYKVLCVDNLRTGRLKNLDAVFNHPNFEWVKLDVCDEHCMEAVFKHIQPDAVLHLAALVSVPESFEKLQVNHMLNFKATEIIAKQCINVQCHRMVFASSAAVYGDYPELPCKETATPDPKSPYAEKKLESERLLMALSKDHPNFDPICFRYFNVYGSRQDPKSPYSGVLSIFSDCFKNNTPITVFGDGNQTRDFVPVKAVATVNKMALSAPLGVKGIYNVCTGYARPLNSILEELTCIYQRTPPIQYLPEREGDIRHSRGDNRLLSNTFGVQISPILNLKSV
jgi:UDP-glucose 4-epimerase